MHEAESSRANSQRGDSCQLRKTVAALIGSGDHVIPNPHFGSGAFPASIEIEIDFKTSATTLHPNSPLISDYTKPASIPPSNASISTLESSNLASQPPTLLEAPLQNLHRRNRGKNRQQWLPAKTTIIIIVIAMARL